MFVSETYELIDAIFKDNATLSDNTNWNTVSSRVTLTRLETYSNLKRKTDATTFGEISIPINVTDFIFEMDLQFESIDGSWVMSFREGSNSKLGLNANSLRFNNSEWHHLKFECKGLNVNYYLDGVNVTTFTFSGSGVNKFQLEARESNSINFKNVVLYPI